VSAVPAAPSSPLREWQARALERMESWQDGPFLVSAAPGAGKTRPAIEAARRLLAAGEARRVVVVCPTTPLTRQWAEAAGRLGLQLLPDADRLVPPPGFHGIAVTYARAASLAAAYERDCTPATLVIADEVHHLGDELAWGDGFLRAFRGARRWLLLSGTPFRSDQAAIPGVRYDGSGTAEPDHAYSYAQAIRDGICRPVAFVAYDGTLRWQSGEDVIESSFGEEIGHRESSRRYRTAISTDLADGLPRILRDANERLMGLRAGEHRDAGGLVIAADSDHARQVARTLKELTGRAPAIVLHAEHRAHERLREFTRGRDPWIVAVNMVSEGVDIPRLRVGVYATVAKTPLIFRQIVGRFVRTIPGRPPEMSWLYLPGDPLLRRLAGEVEEELRHVLHRREDDGLGLLDEPVERRDTERTDAESFVPVSAEVAAQMTLFAGSPDLPAPAAPRPKPAAVPAPEPEIAAVAGEAVFEKRERLRARRHALVGELRRQTGRTPREINAWVNKAAGVSSVGQASVEQLDRSIELLLEELSKRGRRR
jgi:superfamily II DNA or RNA helicase